MFTNEDFLNFISELDIMERNMREVYTSMLNDINDEQIKKQLETLIVDETEHANLMSKLRSIAANKLTM